MREGSSRQFCSDKTILIEFRWALSLLRFELAMERFGRAIKAYDPNQPRVPAGSPAGGQWTDGGFHRLGPRHDPGRQREDEGQVVAQGGRFNPVIRVGNYWLGATPAQQVRLAVSQAQANAALSYVRTIDPSWRPGPSISASTVDGVIARNEALAREAYAHLAQRGRVEPPPMQPREIFAPGGSRVGVQLGASSAIRTVPITQFQQVLEQIMTGAQPTATPPRYEGHWYRRSDGSVIGVRFSTQNGLTIDTVGVIPGIPPNFKVHTK